MDADIGVSGLGVEGPVCFARSEPLDASSNPLIFYDVVDSGLVSRCSVLACIAEAGGGARLPEAVTVSDFRTWITAAGGSENQRLSFGRICTVMKVADAIDDKGMVEWVQLAAEHLERRLHAAHVPSPGEAHIEPLRFWYPTRSDSKVPDSLSLLPDHIQHRVLAEVAFQRVPFLRSSTETSLQGLFRFLPPRFHLSVAKAVNNELRVVLSSDVPPFLKALASLQASPPAISSLEVHEADAYERHHKEQEQADVHAQLFVLLGHHSGLSSLHLSSHCTSATTALLQLLAPALPPLAALTSLHLGTASARFSSDCFHALQHAFEAMPALQELSLSATLSPQPLQTSVKRPRDADAPPVCCLATVISAAPSLTSINIDAATSRMRDGTLAGTVTATLHLPRLRCLQIDANSADWAADLLHHLDGPLTSLVFNRAELCTGVAARDVDRIAKTLCMFTTLETLTIGDHPDWLVAFSATLRRAPAALTGLHKLHNLHMDTDFEALRSDTPLLQVALPGLRTLFLRVSISQAKPTGTQREWSDVCMHLRGLRLLGLEAMLLTDSFNHDRMPFPRDLRLLPCLTALHLSRYNLEKSAGAFEALASMTQLRSLHLVELLGLNPPQALVPCLAALSRLTTLLIEGRCAIVALADASEAGELLGLWPELRTLGLSMQCCDGALRDRLSGVVYSACRLPCMQQIMVDEPHPDDCPDDELEESGSDSASEVDPAVGRSVTRQRRLRRITAAAGVALQTVLHLGNLEACSV